MYMRYMYCYVMMYEYPACLPLCRMLCIVSISCMATNSHSWNRYVTLTRLLINACETDRVWFRYQVETVAESLDLGQVFLLDCGDSLFIWCGTRSSLMARSKTRLLAEKINKFERKNRSSIYQLRPVQIRTPQIRTPHQDTSHQDTSHQDTF